MSFFLCVVTARIHHTVSYSDGDRHAAAVWRFFVAGNISRQSLESIRIGDVIQRWRSTMPAGDNIRCKTCPRYRPIENLERKEEYILPDT